MHPDPADRLTAPLGARDRIERAVESGGMATVSLARSLLWRVGFRRQGARPSRR
jgi:hypothetical protein